MYHLCMERVIIKNELQKYYKPLTVIRILQGVRKPRYKVIVDLHRRGIVPFDAWLDIKSYLNNAEKSREPATTNKKEGV